MKSLIIKRLGLIVGELMPQMGYEPMYFENDRFYIDGPIWTEQIITY